MTVEPRISEFEAVCFDKLLARIMFSKGIPHYTLLYHMDRVAKLCFWADHVRKMPVCVDIGASQLNEIHVYTILDIICVYLSEGHSLQVLQHVGVKFLSKKCILCRIYVKNRQPHHIKTYIGIPSSSVTFPWYNGKNTTFAYWTRKSKY